MIYATWGLITIVVHEQNNFLLEGLVICTEGDAVASSLSRYGSTVYVLLFTVKRLVRNDEIL